MRKTLGTLVVAVLLTFGIYMAIFGRGWGAVSTVGPSPSPSPSASQAAPVVNSLPGVTASAIVRAWKDRWDVRGKETGRQVTLRPKRDVLLTLTRVPDDSEAVWGVSCFQHGKPAPYSRADLTELLDLCLPPSVAGDIRRETVAWFVPLEGGTWRVHRQFNGFTAVVKHFQPKDDDQEPQLQLSLTGGTYFPA